MKKTIIFILIFIYCGNVFSKEYSIHLMWIDKGTSEKEFTGDPSTMKRISNSIVDWSIVNPAPYAKIYFWYDSLYTKNQTLLDKFKNNIIESLRLANVPSTNKKINFMDIRSLNLVRNNKVVFTSNVPIYFRVDLLKKLIAYEFLNVPTRSEVHRVVFTDFDVEPIVESILYKTKTNLKLKKYGMVMAKEKHGFENGFFILTKMNPNMMKAIYEVIIKGSINYVIHFPEENKKRDEYISREIGEQDVYGLYKTMFDYFFHLSTGEPLLIKDKAVIPTEDIFLQAAFSNVDISIKKGSTDFMQEKKNIFDYDGFLGEDVSYVIPTIKVNTENSKFGGEIVTSMFITPKSINKVKDHYISIINSDKGNMLNKKKFDSKILLYSFLNKSLRKTILLDFILKINNNPESLMRLVEAWFIDPTNKEEMSSAHYGVFFSEKPISTILGTEDDEDRIFATLMNKLKKSNQALEYFCNHFKVGRERSDTPLISYVRGDRIRAIQTTLKKSFVNLILSMKNIKKENKSELLDLKINKNVKLLNQMCKRVHLNLRDLIFLKSDI